MKQKLTLMVHPFLVSVDSDMPGDGIIAGCVGIIQVARTAVCLRHITSQQRTRHLPLVPTT